MASIYFPEEILGKQRVPKYDYWFVVVLFTPMISNLLAPGTKLCGRQFFHGAGVGGMVLE